MRFDLFGSAVCTSRLSVETIYLDMTSAVMERNDCPLDAKQGYADMAGVLLLFLLLLVLGKAQDKAAEYTDTQVSWFTCAWSRTRADLGTRSMYVHTIS